MENNINDKEQIVVQQEPVYQPNQPAEDPEVRIQKANTLCSISLGLHFLPVLIVAIMVGYNRATGGTNVLEGFLGRLITSIYGASFIGSWVTMIIARVKYKESVFAKVLMWVYIGIAIIGVIGFIALVAMCIYNLSQCPD